MTDLTKITTPFGLLDPETQAALKAHDGPIEIFDYYGEWGAVNRVNYWQENSTYRVKLTPPKPRECWSYGEHIRYTEADAIAFRQDVAGSYPGKGYELHPITKWIEVLP